MNQVNWKWERRHVNIFKRPRKRSWYEGDEWWKLSGMLSDKKLKEEHFTIKLQKKKKVEYCSPDIACVMLD